MSLVKIRSLKPEDVPFIRNSSYESIKEGMERAGSGITIDTKDYRKNMNLLQEYWLSTCTIRILCDRESEDTILGYNIYQEEEDTAGIWFIYIKQAFRRQGMAKLLVDRIDSSKYKIYFPTSTYHSIKNSKNLSPETQEFLNNTSVALVYKFVGQYNLDESLK